MYLIINLIAFSISETTTNEKLESFANTFAQALRWNAFRAGFQMHRMCRIGFRIHGSELRKTFSKNCTKAITVAREFLKFWRP